MSHFDQLRAAFGEEWRIVTKPPQLQRADLYDDNTRYWVCEDHVGQVMINWECRRFPGCDTLIITTKVELRNDLRGRGLGRFFRELRHRAYRRAGFAGELATVRSDNAPQNNLMASMGGVAMGEFRSDFGGTYRLWLTNLAPLTQPQNVHPQNMTYTGIMGDQVQVRPLRWVGETLPDAMATTPPTVQPLPGASVLPGRRHTTTYAHRGQDGR